MNVHKIPFETKYEQVYFEDVMVLMFVASRTFVFTRFGDQYTSISHDECVELLNTPHECKALCFGAKTSLNVLIVLKVGI